MHGTYDYGLWTVVLINILIFGAFVLGFLRPKRKYEWRSMGVFVGFIVALFTEMYGFPLTIYVLISLFGTRFSSINPFVHVKGHLLGTLLGLPDVAKLLICQIGSVLMLIGLIIMGKGWWRIHHAQGQLVTDGIYAALRHPQYFGLFLLSIGMLIQWPTILTLVMWPILTIVYYKLAKREEKECEMRFGQVYQLYKQEVPAFFPNILRKRIRNMQNSKQY